MLRMRLDGFPLRLESENSKEVGDHGMMPSLS